MHTAPRSPLHFTLFSPRRLFIPEFRAPILYPYLIIMATEPQHDFPTDAPPAKRQKIVEPVEPLLPALATPTVSLTDKCPPLAVLAASSVVSGWMRNMADVLPTYKMNEMLKSPAFQRITDLMSNLTIQHDAITWKMDKYTNDQLEATWLNTDFWRDASPKEVKRVLDVRPDNSCRCNVITNGRDTFRNTFPCYHYVSSLCDCRAEYHQNVIENFIEAHHPRSFGTGAYTAVFCSTCFESRGQSQHTSAMLQSIVCEMLKWEGPRIPTRTERLIDTVSHAQLFQDLTREIYRTPTGVSVKVFV